MDRIPRYIRTYLLPLQRYLRLVITDINEMQVQSNMAAMPWENLPDKFTLILLPGLAITKSVKSLCSIILK